MDLDYLYDNFVKPNPEVFLKIISAYYPFNKELFLEFYPMLSWGNQELNGNINIDWDYDLFERFEKKLTECYPSCWIPGEINKKNQQQSLRKVDKLTTTFLKNENVSRKEIEKIEKAGTLTFDKIDEKFLDKFHSILRKDDWSRISLNFKHPITEDLLIKYRRNLSLSVLVNNNENIDLSIPTVYKYLVENNWNLHLLPGIWNNLFKNLLDDKPLKYLLEKFRSQKKVFNVIWVDKLQGKYYIEIFIQTSRFRQMIDCGYCFLNKTIELKKMHYFPDNFKIIATNHKSVIDNKNIRTLVFEPYKL